MNTLPKIYTREDQTAEDVRKWREGGERDRLLLMLRAFSSSRNNLPISDDHWKIAQGAINDFQGRDFSDAEDVVDSLAQIVDFYKDLAEGYLTALTNLGAVTDQYGSVTTEPFVVTQNGEPILGAVETFDIDEAGRDETTWSYYIKPYLPFASEREQKWIAENFAEFIEGEEA